MEIPNVLFVIPLYNAAHYVRKAINSVLTQTYQNYVLLVINDGSTDGSEIVAESFCNDRVFVWHQENQGPGTAMNLALQYALDQHIPFIARMDSDDISMPQRLERQINLLKKYPSTAACSANCYYIDAVSEKKIGSSTISTSPGLIRWEIEHGLRGLILGGCTFRTHALYKIGGFREKFKYAEEVDVFLRLSNQFELRNCNEFLCNIRIRSDSLSIKNLHKNILYQFYALDCAKNRRHELVEKDFDTFLKSRSLKLRYQIWREEFVLNLWRKHMYKRHFPSLLLASFLDPRRTIVRGIRNLTKLSIYNKES